MKIEKIKDVYDDDINDDGKLEQRFWNKQVNAKKEGLRCLLTYEEFCDLVRNAGLVSSQLGFGGDNYVLARINDDGDYTYDNCRFISQRWNENEKQDRLQREK